jgi:hypothetical protein
MPGAISLVADFTGCSASALADSFLQRAAAALVLHYPGAVASCCLISAPSSVQALWSSISVALPQWMAAGVHMLEPADTESGIAALRERFPEHTVREILHEYPDCASLTRLVPSAAHPAGAGADALETGDAHAALAATSPLAYDWCPRPCTGGKSAWGIEHEDAVIAGSAAGAVASATALADDDAERFLIAQALPSPPAPSAETPLTTDASILEALSPEAQSGVSDGLAGAWTPPGLVVRGALTTTDDHSSPAAAQAATEPAPSLDASLATTASDAVEVVEWGAEDVAAAPRSRGMSRHSSNGQKSEQSESNSVGAGAGAASQDGQEDEADEEESIMI